jgi:hypothetical protein
LKGAAVSLIPAAAIGRFNCFRIISPSIEISFQAESVAELKEWAAALFHGAAIANGGGFILEEVTNFSFMSLHRSSYVITNDRSALG